jgi:CheY-like chemotaxis protein
MAARYILYIEDQPDIIDLVRLALRRMDVQVHSALDGEQGIRLMRELKPDLVLLDLMLPGWDGWQVRDLMLADPELRSIPVVLVTARMPISLGSDGDPLPPADAYITKPFALSDMRSTIERVLDRALALAN